MPKSCTAWFLLSAGFPSGSLEFRSVQGSQCLCDWPLTQSLNTETPRGVQGGPHPTRCPSVAWEDLSEDCVATPERESQEFLQTLPESSGSAEPTEGPAPESCETPTSGLAALLSDGKPPALPLPPWHPMAFKASGHASTSELVLPVFLNYRSNSLTGG